MRLLTLLLLLFVVLVTAVTTVDDDNQINLSFTNLLACTCDCNDGNSCTVDSCDPVLGCIYTPVICPSDGNPCTNELCSDGRCILEDIVGCITDSPTTATPTTANPTVTPTAAPSASPTTGPTQSPTSNPTVSPTTGPPPIPPSWHGSINTLPFCNGQCTHISATSNTQFYYVVSNTHVYYITSFDGGLSWTPPVLIYTSVDPITSIHSSGNGDVIVYIDSTSSIVTPGSNNTRRRLGTTTTTVTRSVDALQLLSNGDYCYRDTTDIYYYSASLGQFIVAGRSDTSGIRLSNSISCAISPLDNTPSIVYTATDSVIYYIKSLTIDGSLWSMIAQPVLGDPSLRNVRLIFNQQQKATLIFTLLDTSIAQVVAQDQFGVAWSSPVVVDLSLHTSRTYDVTASGTLLYIDQQNNDVVYKEQMLSHNNIVFDVVGGSDVLSIDVADIHFVTWLTSDGDVTLTHNGTALPMYFQVPITAAPTSRAPTVNPNATSSPTPVPTTNTPQPTTPEPTTMLPTVGPSSAPTPHPTPITFPSCSNMFNVDLFNTNTPIFNVNSSQLSVNTPAVPFSLMSTGNANIRNRAVLFQRVAALPAVDTTYTFSGLGGTIQADVGVTPVVYPVIMYTNDDSCDLSNISSLLNTNDYSSYKCDGADDPSNIFGVASSCYCSPGTTMAFSVRSNNPTAQIFIAIARTCVNNVCVSEPLDTTLTLRCPIELNDGSFESYSYVTRSLNQTELQSLFFVIGATNPSDSTSLSINSIQYSCAHDTSQMVIDSFDNSVTTQFTRSSTSAVIDDITNALVVELSTIPTTIDYTSTVPLDLSGYTQFIVDTGASTSTITMLITLCNDDRQCGTVNIENSVSGYIYDALPLSKSQRTNVVSINVAITGISSASQSLQQFSLGSNTIIDTC